MGTGYQKMSHVPNVDFALFKRSCDHMMDAPSMVLCGYMSIHILMGTYYNSVQLQIRRNQV